MTQGLVRFAGIGCIVEYLQGNAVQIALVLEEHSGKLRLLLPNRRELPLQANRLLPWSGPSYGMVPSKDEGVNLLEKHRVARVEAGKAFDVTHLWELAQGEVDRASAEWFAQLAMDDPDIDAVAACGQALLNCKSHFKFQPPDFDVYTAETAALRIAESEAAKARELLAARGSAWFACLWEAHSKKKIRPARDNAAYPEPELEQRLSSLIMDRLIDPDDTTQEVTWRLLVKGLPDDPFMPLYLATAWGLVPPYYNFWLDRADYAPGNVWSDKYAQATASLREQVGMETDPLLSDSGMSAMAARQYELVSIDSASTRDIDDAFFIARTSDGWDITLAIACPALYWDFGSDLDLAVRKRATSIYLPEATHHMLPEELGADGYSLVAGQPRPAMLIHCRVNADGSLAQCFLECRRVNLSANLSYDQVQKYFDGEDSVAAPYGAMLGEALELAKIRQDWRIGRGAVVIDRPEPEFCLEPVPDSEDVVVRMEEETLAAQAQLLVSEFMILGNAAVAVWAQERGVALFFRTQHVGIPKEFAGIWQTPHEIARIARVLPPAALETAPRSHAGIGEPLYAPSTSPLRRYADMVNQAQMLSVLKIGQPKWSKDEMDAMLAPLSLRLDAAQQAQRMRLRFWKLLYIKQQGERRWWPAVITDESDNYIAVTLPREQVFVRGKRALFGARIQPGQALEVRLNKINPLSNDIYIAETREVE
jgi:exoribonuclease-2